MLLFEVKTNADRIKSLEKSIHELGESLTCIDLAFESTRSKILFFLSGGIAFLSFLFGADKTFTIPIEIYGRIFFFSGLGASILSVSVLIYSIFPVTWHLPTEKKRLEKIDFNSYLLFLEYLNQEHLISYTNNLASLAKKQDQLVTALSRQLTPLRRGF